MSLIDEALKRAQDAESARREGERPPERPWTPAPLPDAGLARRRRLVRIGSWALAALAGVVVLVVAARAVWNASAPAPGAASRTAGLAPSPEPTLAETIVATPAARSGAAAPAQPRPTHAVPAAVGEPAPSPATAVAPGGPPPSMADGRSYRVAVDLPGGGRIELGGIVWSEEAPRALLNDRIVGVDAYVEGFTVSKIEESRVALVRDGVTIYLTLK